MRNRSIRDFGVELLFLPEETYGHYRIIDSDIYYGTRKRYLPSLMDNVDTDITYMTSLYKYYNIPIPESGVDPSDFEIYIAKRSNGTAVKWWCRTYFMNTYDKKYYNVSHTTDGYFQRESPHNTNTCFVRPIINLSNYTKVRFENGNYYID